MRRVVAVFWLISAYLLVSPLSKTRVNLLGNQQYFQEMDYANQKLEECVKSICD